MAKRFIDTSIFRKDFVRGLDAPCKLLWFYIICECDHAGIWDAELDVAQVRLGIKINGDPIKCMNGRVIPIDDGRKWFIPSFVEFQYGQLNTANRAHQSVINILSKYNLLDEDFNILKEAPCKPLASPSGGAMDMDKDKVMDKDNDKDKARAKKEKPADLIPEAWSRQEFLYYWADFEKVRKSKKKQLTDIAVKRLVSSLVRFSGGEWYKAKAIMEKTIVGAWDAFYELKPGDLATVEAERPVEYGVWVNGKKVS